MLYGDNGSDTEAIGHIGGHLPAMTVPRYQKQTKERLNRIVTAHLCGNALIVVKSLVRQHQRVSPAMPHQVFATRVTKRSQVRIQRIEYFDRARRPLKVLTVDDYALHDDRFWKAARMNMENLQTGKSTELQWRDYRFATGLSADRDFSTNSLLRAR